MSGKLVLVVDDEPAIAQFIQLLLEDSGYRTLVAHTGMEALTAVLKGPPDLIVLDIRMPLMTGWNVLDHLHKSGFTALPVIAMSADYMVAEDARKYPICGYLDKPFLPDDLLHLVTQCIGQPHQTLNV